jgi:hypothetical protein
VGAVTGTTTITIAVSFKLFRNILALKDLLCSLFDTNLAGNCSNKAGPHSAKTQDYSPYV